MQLLSICYMKTSTFTYKTKPISIICASLLFIAIFKLPIEYYTILRIVVFIGALLVLNSFIDKSVSWIIVFGLIAILFNPIIPLYLYVKDYWIPIDIVSGVLFLLCLIPNKTNKKVEKEKCKKPKEFQRDKIY